MAGIGFKLQNLIKSDSLLSSLKAYSYSALISSGPWIYSLLSFIVISFFITADLNMNKIFQAIIIYIFAFSQIIAGFFQLITTRIISDYIYSGRFEMISAYYLRSLAFLFPILTIIGAFLFGMSCPDIPCAVITTFLFIIMGGVWQQLIILTACRDFKAISSKFAGGFFIAVTVSIMLGSSFGLAFYFLGFTLGVLYIFWQMHLEILNEFPFQKWPDSSEEKKIIIKYRSLFLTGLFFNLAVWIDKILFWYLGGGKVCGLLYENSVYDRLNLIFVAILIPVMALFTLKIETNFYVKFRNFYKAITEKESLDYIEMNFDSMKKSIIKGAQSVLKITVPMAFFIIIFSEQIMTILKLSADYRANWTAFTFGAVFHSFFLLTMILLMYFDFLKETLACVCIFLASNFTINLLGILLFGNKFMGFGYAASTAVSLAAAVMIFRKCFDDILYYSFERERIPDEIILKIK